MAPQKIVDLYTPHETLLANSGTLGGSLDSGCDDG